MKLSQLSGASIELGSLCLLCFQLISLTILVRANDTASEALLDSSTSIKRHPYRKPLSGNIESPSSATIVQKKQTPAANMTTPSPSTTQAPSTLPSNKVNIVAAVTAVVAENSGSGSGSSSGSGSGSGSGNGSGSSSVSVSVSADSHSGEYSDNIYSRWSPWSKCSRNCKQTRSRACKRSNQCEVTVIREERRCRIARCREAKNNSNNSATINSIQRSNNTEQKFGADILSPGRNHTTSPSRLDKNKRPKNQHRNSTTTSTSNNRHRNKTRKVNSTLSASDKQQHNRRKKEEKTKVLYHLQNVIYSDWSAWSPCHENCTTTRTRTCEMNVICGSAPIIRETFICYTEGSICETKYNKPNFKREIVGFGNNNLPNLPENRYFDEEHSDEIESTYTPTTLPSSQSFNTGSSIFSETNDVDYVGYLEPSLIYPIDDSTCGMMQMRDMASILRIVGGSESPIGQWPWQVVVLDKNQDPICGGTLITPEFVLTAAHCVKDKLYVRAGEHDLDIIENTEQQRGVSSAYVHPAYNQVNVDSDIALLRLKFPLRLTQNVWPACLPKFKDELRPSTMATILGWGVVDYSIVNGSATDNQNPSTIVISKLAPSTSQQQVQYTRSNYSTMSQNPRLKIAGNDNFMPKYLGASILNQAKVPIAKFEDCKHVYKEYYISDNMICAGYERGRVDSCAGDSGGPLLVQRSNKWYVYGVTSFGEGCGRQGKYGIYCKTSNFVKWIRDIVYTFGSTMKKVEGSTR